jgi:hypothetical protein
MCRYRSALNHRYVLWRLSHIRGVVGDAGTAPDRRDEDALQSISGITVCVLDDPFVHRIPVSQETSARMAEPDSTATEMSGQRGQLDGATTTSV